MKKNKIFVIVLTILLFVIPFFWFHPGETDYGGDSSRLYFYNPLAYLSAQTLYGIISSGVGGENVGYYSIPFIILLWLLKSIVGSPPILASIFNGLTLSLAFLSCYLIIKDLFACSYKKSNYNEVAAILAGLFYVFTPTLTLGWDKAILTHFQFFLNPLMFWLLFRFIVRKDLKYLLLALLVSFIFSSNFTFVAAPGFFAFYPLAILFIILYALLVLKRSIPLKSMLLGIVVFILLQLFHLGPQVSSLFTGGSQINSNVFSAESIYTRGLSYFLGVAPSVKVSYSWLDLAQLFPMVPIWYGFVIFPIIILLGFIFNKNRQYLLTGIFFLITFFFVTANITDAGFAFYKKLFDYPGFSMFRNFFGQWVFVFTFFYMLLFGQALQTTFEKVKRVYIYPISAVIVIFLVINAWPLINGSLLNKDHFQSKNVRIPSEIDPEYEKVLSYITNLQTDGKFISFPLTDPGYQIIMGKQGGAYQGPSTISYLTGKNDFTGYDGLIPFSETFLTLVKNNDIDRINRLFAILNVKYVFYNSDPAIYDDTFPKYPYTNVRETMPDTQKGYQSFLSKLPMHKVKDFGDKYHIYEVNTYLPHIYTANDITYASDALTPYFSLNNDDSLRAVVFTEPIPLQKDTKVILQATNNNPLSELVNNYHLHVADPFISRRPDDIFYPLVARKEKQSLKNLQADQLTYIDYSLLFLSKRVSELQKYDKTPITHTSFQEPKLWELNKWNSYYSWEASLTRYDTEARSLMAWIANAHATGEKKNSMKIMLNESLSQHELRLKNIINDSKYTDMEKAYLATKSKKMFHDLYGALALTLLDNTQIPYSLEIPQDAKGDYTPYIQFPEDTKPDASAFSLKVNNKVTEPVNTASESPTITFNTLAIANTTTNFSLHYKPRNLVDTSKWAGAGSVIQSPNETVLQIDKQFGAGSGFSKQIDDYKPSVQYLISFEYYIEGDDLLFKVAEDQLDINKKFSRQMYFTKLLTSKSWKMQQSIFTSNPNAVHAYLQFITANDNYSGKLHLRNVSITSVPNPTILFRKVTGRQQPQALPTIVFKKLNPTRYTIDVSNAKNPYSLVFSEAFSNNWKVYKKKRPQTKNTIGDTYFDGQVQEQQHENIFFKMSFLRNEGLPLTSPHLRGNGYANVWNIRPADVSGKDTYELDLVYIPQIYFYYYLAISLLTFVGIVITLAYLFLKRK
jgi:hypothetical protein